MDRTVADTDYANSEEANSRSPAFGCRGRVARNNRCNNRRDHRNSKNRLKWTARFAIATDLSDDSTWGHARLWNLSWRGFLFSSSPGHSQATNDSSDDCTPARSSGAPALTFHIQTQSNGVLWSNGSLHTSLPDLRYGHS